VTTDHRPADLALRQGAKTPPPSSPTPSGPEDDVEMGFFDHLGELRTRIIRVLYGVIPGLIVGWIFRAEILEFALQPLAFALRTLELGEPQVHFKGLTDPFVAYVKIALITGLLASAPWTFWQVWAFISPGLYRREKLLAVPFIVASTVCFAGGALFGYFVVFPMGMETLLGLAGKLPSESMTLQPTIMIDEYMTFVTRMLLAFGVVFEIPVVVTFLAAAGIVDWKQLLSFGRWWVVIAAALASVLTPPDVGSQLLMLGPLIALYYLSVLLAFIFGWRRAKREQAAAAGDDDAEAP
jgi:sec-independent protein translocase protein TatC